MRVSMSAMGSLMLMADLPAGLGHAGDLTRESQATEADATQGEAPNERARPSAQLAPVVLLHFEPGRPLGLGDHGFLGQF
jgi:hypothetical protein